MDPKRKDDADRRTLVQIALEDVPGDKIESMTTWIKFENHKVREQVALMGTTIKTPEKGAKLYFELVSYDKTPEWLKEPPK